MSRRDEQAVVGAPPSADDGLLLPRPPGVLRRVWARHPRVADVLVAVAGMVLSVPVVVFRADYPTPATPAQAWFAAVLVGLACVALLFRRARPLAVLCATMVPALVLPPSLVAASHLLPALALYAVAVYRSMRACWTAFGIACAALGAYAVVAALNTPSDVGFVITALISAIIALLIGGLIGTSVGNRRRYLEALIDRSRQLMVERDQQAQLAAAAERTRIAREMHDIVSHNLTVVVALAEGAAATPDPARARTATEQIAATARGALTEMRAMLGVLRDPEATPGTPPAPIESASAADAVDAAQRAGFPVLLRTQGAVDALGADVRLAVTRIVQESLTNAMRHAPAATRIDVDIVVDPDAVDVEVVNDGVRPASRQTTPGVRGGYGIPGLRERAAHVGGSLSAGETAGGRWVVHAHLPRRERDDTAEEHAP